MTTATPLTAGQVFARPQGNYDGVPIITVGGEGEDEYVAFGHSIDLDRFTRVVLETARYLGDDYVVDVITGERTAGLQAKRAWLVATEHYDSCHIYDEPDEDGEGGHVEPFCDSVCDDYEWWASWVDDVRPGAVPVTVTSVHR